MTTPLLPITTDAENDAALAEVEALWDRDEDGDLSPAEAGRLDALITLIQHYEDVRYPPRGVSPHGVLQHLMEARALTHKDVWPLFGSKGIASEVLNGKRAISKAQVKKLAAFFHVSAALLVHYEDQRYPIPRPPRKEPST